MTSSDTYRDCRRDIEIRGQDSDSVSRDHSEATTSTKNAKGKEKLMNNEDEETMELYARARAQEKEIIRLREQIALASIRESRLLNEKYTLERKFSELRMALDEKQGEIIASASNELVRRKGDLEVNFSLLNELKVVEEERKTFTFSMLEILGEYGAWPHVTNASALSYNIKFLHDKLQLKIRTSHGAHESSQFRDHVNGRHLESGDEQKNAPASVKSWTRGGEIRRLTDSGSLLKRLPEIDRNIAGHIVDELAERTSFSSTAEQMPDQFSHHPRFLDRVVSFDSVDEAPGIENFQIIGDARPGCRLLGCGYPVRGTSLCMFQWVRHYPDGTRHYIEGATNPDYIVTADDVDKLVAVECIPMDEKGQQGEIVRLFANESMKITCDAEMQEAIDTYISKSQATFNVLILLDSSENWEPVTLFLRRSGFQIKFEKKQDPIISEKYSKELSIKIPAGMSPQFVLIFSDGLSYPFSTSDVRLRDTVVLTMRHLQSKFLDEKRKSKS